MATLPDVELRLDLIHRVRGELARGTYVTPEKIDVVVERMLVDLGLAEAVSAEAVSAEDDRPPPRRSRPRAAVRGRRARAGAPDHDRTLSAIRPAGRGVCEPLVTAGGA